MKIELLSITPNSQKLIEEVGRTCYKSEEKITEDSYKKFIKSAIRRGHFSILEHASATFRITGGSRTFTHQLVRHRLCSFSQESQRYVKECGNRMVTPDSIQKIDSANWIFQNQIRSAEKTYTDLIRMGIKKEDARFVLPNACTSEIVVSANFRQWRNVLTLRLEKSAQWEIRKAANKILKILFVNAPSVFDDLYIMYVIERIKE